MRAVCSRKTCAFTVDFDAQFAYNGEHAPANIPPMETSEKTSTLKSVPNPIPIKNSYPILEHLL